MSEWHYSGVKRRDFRHTHGLDPEVPRHTGARHKKNCKRNKGGEHVAADHYVIDGYLAVRRCNNCGKHLEHRYQHSWWRGEKPLPMEEYVSRLNAELKRGL